MNLEEKLRSLKQGGTRHTRDADLERALQYLHRAKNVVKSGPPVRKRVPVEEYVNGRTEGNSWGEFFLTGQSLPFGRPYGKLRIGDVSSADLSPLRLFLKDAELPDPSQIAFLDTETTGLAGGTGTCAFLMGIGVIEGSEFVVRQFFLRDFPEEKAALAALAEVLGKYQALVTYNGKTFDVPLLQTRFSLARMKSPFDAMLHLDLLHAARRLWKLRLENCKLANLEQEVLGISREGDLPGSEIPGIYFDYLRTGNAGRLQPIFYHNALDILTLAALTVELARLISEAGTSLAMPSLDLFSLSRIFERAGDSMRSVSICRQALASGLPKPVEARALWQLAVQHKRERKYEAAAEIWLELACRKEYFAIEALEELAILHEHRRRDYEAALGFTETAIQQLGSSSQADSRLTRFNKRSARLLRKLGGASSFEALRPTGAQACSYR